MITTNEENLSVLITCDSKDTYCSKTFQVQVHPDTYLAKKIVVILQAYQQGAINKEQLVSNFEDFREAVRQDFTSKGWLGVSNDETYCHEHKGEVNV